MLNKQSATSDQKQSSADGSTIHALVITLPNGSRYKLQRSKEGGDVAQSQHALFRV